MLGNAGPSRLPATDELEDGKAEAGGRGAERAETEWRRLHAHRNKRKRVDSSSGVGEQPTKAVNHQSELRDPERPGLYSGVISRAESVAGDNSGTPRGESSVPKAASGAASRRTYALTPLA